MRFVRSRFSLVVAIAAALAATASASGSATHASALLVQPASLQVRTGYMAPVPFTDAQCEATYRIQCYLPDQVEAAYNLPALYNRGITGKGRTIVVVDAFGSPTIADDLLQFDQALGLGAGAPPLSVVQVGRIPAYDPQDRDMVEWAGETTLDVEYAHAGAPDAKIVLVEAASNYLGPMTDALRYAIQHQLGDVISLSWAWREQDLGADIAGTYDHVFKDAARRHITIVASSGDAGVLGNVDDYGNYSRHPDVTWPAASPYVTAVGGTQLNLNASGSRNGPDSAWNDTYDNAAINFYFGHDAPVPLAAGGGKSAIYGRPAYQNGVRDITGSQRGVPDISMSASCSVAVNVYQTDQTASGTVSGWSAACGTSESAPMFAAVIALAAQLAGHPLGPVNPVLYALAARHAPGIVPVASGNNTVTFGGTTVHGYTAGRRYNLVTGLGTIDGLYLVPELARA